MLKPPAPALTSRTPRGLQASVLGNMLTPVTFLTVCPAAFRATKLSGTPTAADIFCSEADSRVNCRQQAAAAQQEALRLAAERRLTESGYLSEVNHPVRVALWDQIVGGHQVDQVQVAAELQPLQTFQQVFIQNRAVGQIH